MPFLVGTSCSKEELYEGMSKIMMLSKPYGILNFIRCSGPGSSV